MTGRLSLYSGADLIWSRVRSSLDVIASSIRPGRSSARPNRWRSCAADAQEPAEVDDGGARAAGTVDDDIDEPADVLVGFASDLLAENAFGLLGAEHHRWAVGLSGSSRFNFSVHRFLR